MKNMIQKILGLSLAFGLSMSPVLAEDVLINGAGASFPYPIYSKWFDEFHKQNPEYKFNYQSIGSGGGIRQITARTVDFGASDAPMRDADIENAPAYLVHIPTVMGAVVVTYNIPGVTENLNLTPKAVAGIFLGDITKWNDPEIQNANPNVKLPSDAIVVIHRSDGSGTTSIFVDFLSKVSSSWATKVGVGTSVAWPVGLGGKGNEGVAGLVKQTPNSVGYVELVYARNNGLSYGKIQNKSGKFILPSMESVSAAGKGKIPSDFRVSITNSPAPDAYPISGFTWLLVYQKQTDSVKGKAMVEFLKWMVKDGQRLAPDLGYAPLPKEVITMVESAIQKIKVK